MPLETDLLRSFVAVAEAGSLTRAGERLRLAQPTISLQLRRLEQRLGRRLVERTPRQLRLTAEGEMLLPYARRILALSEEAEARLAEAGIEGLVRLGTPEDFATTHLAGVLARFAQGHPRVALEVTTDLTLHLLERFRAAEFDVVLIKREPAGPAAGIRVWREALVWAAASPDAFARPGVLPLVVSPHPCVYRRRAMQALDAAGRRWRVAYTSTSLAGAQAAVRAGLGVTVLPRGMVPPDLAILPDGPDLRDTEIALMTAEPLSLPARRLAEHIIRSLEQQAAGG
ncbi:MAG: LysR substrate-binding domain-containing protein [Rhodovarius sp.]|nr:LysR substrate-binding domain-containing protein [Rhodovarius sp.]